jgi:transposase/predicted RNA-binding Zn-ribbon protein involved in translation (DUF1610 family)
VLRHLGLRQNGGAHAHLRRRITQFGIDTSHFLGKAHARGVPSNQRRAHHEILVMRPTGSKREAPAALRRALEELGRPYRCAECGIDAMWNGRALTLHVDHIDGQFWDCRPENVRFLCPNCHSQTATYAGRNTRRSEVAFARVDEHGNTIEPGDASKPLSEREKADVLALVEREEMTVSDAARIIGCSRNHVYELQRRLKEHGSVAPLPRRRRITEAEQRAVIETAVADPTLGARRIASALSARPSDPIVIAPSSVRGILKATGLSTTRDRLAAAEGLGRQSPSKMQEAITQDGQIGRKWRNRHTREP